MPLVVVLRLPRARSRCGRRPAARGSRAWPTRPRQVVLLQKRAARRPSSRPARRWPGATPGWPRNAAEAVLVWDRDRSTALGRLLRSLEDHLGDDVWVLDPDRAGRQRRAVQRRQRHRRDLHRPGRRPTAGSSRCRRRPTIPGRGGAGRRRAARRRPRPTCSAHGTTVATNALLERRGATVALVTNAGFADVIEIGRQDRPSLYDQTADRPEPLVARAPPLRGRRSARRRRRASSTPLDLDDAARARPDGVEAVAVVPPARRPRTRPTSRPWPTRLRGAGLRRERVARGVARVPRVRAHGHHGGQRLPAPGLPRLPRRAGRRWPTRCVVMTSAGGLVPVGGGRRAAGAPAAVADRRAACWPAAAAAVANGWPDAVTFDMGGTSTDVCLVLDGRPGAGRPSGWSAGFAGAAAVARRAHHRGRRRLDRRARRRRRAGRRARAAPAPCPGPACYGRGGDRAHGHRRRPGGRPHPRRRRAARASGALDVDAARRRARRRPASPPTA